MALADYINNKPVIETNRLILRPMIVSDIAALKKLFPDCILYSISALAEVLKLPKL